MNKIDILKVAEVKLSYSTKVKASDRVQITSSKDAECILREYWDDTMEHIESMKLILLNRANKVLGITNLTTGGTTGTVCDVKVVFQYAINANATGIILAHNHPSGNLNTSTQDRTITSQIREAGKFLNISLLDHLILSPYDGYLSLADEGLL